MDRGTGAGLSTVMETCLYVEKPNSTVAPLILAVVIEIAPRESGAEKPIEKMKVVKDATAAKRAEYLDHEGERVDHGRIEKTSPVCCFATVANLSSASADVARGLDVLLWVLTPLEVQLFVAVTRFRLE